MHGRILSSFKAGYKKKPENLYIMIIVGRGTPFKLFIPSSQMPKAISNAHNTLR